MLGRWLEVASVVNCCWASDAFFFFVSVAGEAVDFAGWGLFLSVGEVFSYWEEGCVVDVSDGVEFGSSYSFATS